MRALFVTLVFVATVAIAQPNASDEALQSAAARLDAASTAAAASAARPGDENLTCEQLQAEIVQIGQSTNLQAFAAGQSAFGSEQLARAQMATQAQQAIQGAGSRSEQIEIATAAQTAAAAANAPAGESEPTPAEGRRRGGLMNRVAGGFGASAAGAAAGGLFGGRGSAGAAVASAAAQTAAANAAGGGVDTSASRAGAEQLAVGLGETNEALANQADALAAMSPQVMRGAHLVGLAETRSCAFLNQ